jgi:hypothetical protein
VNIRGRLARLEAAERKPTERPTGQAWADAEEAYHSRSEGWRAAFRRGEERPVPTRPHARRQEDPAFARRTLVVLACIDARVDREIGPLDYLPRMTPEEQAETDMLCGALWSACRQSAGEDLDVAGDEFPEWGRFGSSAGGTHARPMRQGVTP